MIQEIGFALDRSFYFDWTHVIDTTEKFSLDVLCYWLQLCRIDIQQGEGLGLDWGRGSD